MSVSQWIVFAIEIIGTMAFASSGAMVGIKKKMDIFGVNVLGITTAIGGGIIRDLVLGIHPPETFKNPVYVCVAIATSCILFIVAYMNQQILESDWMVRYEKIMIAMDAIGLGAFTVIGIYVALDKSQNPTSFLLIFVGMITGIGGGMLRDIMAGMTPFVFVKHIYASASMIGAIVCVVLLKLLPLDIPALILGAATTVIVRLLAAHYHWNLPRVEGQKEKGIE